MRGSTTHLHATHDDEVWPVRDTLRLASKSIASPEEKYSTSDDSSYYSSGSSDFELSPPASPSKHGLSVESKEEWMEDMGELIQEGYLHFKKHTTIHHQLSYVPESINMEPQKDYDILHGFNEKYVESEQYIHFGMQLDSLDIASKIPLRVAVSSVKREASTQPTHRRTRSMLFLHPDHQNQDADSTPSDLSGLEVGPVCSPLKCKRKSFLDVPELPTIVE